MEKIKRLAFCNLLGIIVVMGGTIALIATGVLNIAALILAIIGCYPMAVRLWWHLLSIYLEPVHRLRKALPKAGASIESEGWNEEQNAFEFSVSYQDNKFTILAKSNNGYLMIFDEVWCAVKVSDPMIPQIMEAANEVNANSSNMSVVICEPENDNRLIYTVCKTILPNFNTASYLEWLLCDILNRRSAFQKSINKERPYMTQRHNTVGFNIPTEPSTNSDDETVTPAATIAT